MHFVGLLLCNVWGYILVINDIYFSSFVRKLMAKKQVYHNKPVRVIILIHYWWWKSPLFSFHSSPSLSIYLTCIIIKPWCSAHHSSLANPTSQQIFSAIISSEKDPYRIWWRHMKSVGKPVTKSLSFRLVMMTVEARTSVVSSFSPNMYAYYDDTS